MTDLLGKCGLPVWEEEPQGDDVGLVIRNVSAELKSYGGFAWPESGYVEAPDWRDSATCGNGLHGLLDGIGEWSLLSDAHDARWQIVKVARSEVVRIDDAKVKFPRGWVVFTGGSAAAKKFILPAMVASVFKGAEGNTATGYNGHAAATGDNGHAAATGDNGHAAATGDRGHAAATGDNGHAAATGDNGHAAATGYSGHAAATGYSGHAAATGDNGHAAATGYSGHAAATGDNGHAAATGDRGHAAATGDRGHAAATGDSGHAAATGYSGHAAATGDRGHAAATGDRGIAASLGIYARAKAAKDGAIMLAEWVHDRQRWTIASVFASKVGENGIEPDVWYELKDGKPVKVTEQSE